MPPASPPRTSTSTGRLSREGHDMIASYKVEGEQLFFPDFKP
jgi:hypothetical protein